jgi:hypothetical protein
VAGRSPATPVPPERSTEQRDDGDERDQDDNRQFREVLRKLAVDVSVGEACRLSGQHQIAQPCEPGEDDREPDEKDVPAP